MNHLLFMTMTIMLSGFVISSQTKNSTYLGKAPEKFVQTVECSCEDDSDDETKTESETEHSKKTNETNRNYMKKSLGTFKLTAYCSCEKCCGSYAKNRPVDENGKRIVYGSSGEILKEGISIAVDTKVIPFGTKVIIEDNEYIAHDTGGAIKSNKIDVYFEDHQKAVEFGVQHKEVFVYEE